jgi:hypothetical protein
MTPLIFMYNFSWTNFFHLVTSFRLNGITAKKIFQSKECFSRNIFSTERNFQAKGPFVRKVVFILSAHRNSYGFSMFLMIVDSISVSVGAVVLDICRWLDGRLGGRQTCGLAGLGAMELRVGLGAAGKFL